VLGLAKRKEREESNGKACRMKRNKRGLK